MVVSKYIKEVIVKNYSEIAKDVPIADILYDLRESAILSDEEVSKLRDHCKSDQDCAFEFLKILKSRSDRNFYQFCTILQHSDIENVQDLGKKLERAATAVVQKQKRNSRENSKPTTSVLSTKRKRHQSHSSSEDSKAAHKRLNNEDAANPISSSILSDHVREALLCSREEFERKMPYDNIKLTLRQKNVLTSEEIDLIDDKKIKAERSAALFEILLTRDDADFYIVCAVLEAHPLNSFKALGKEMRCTAKKLSK
ncbi:hypothetical protein TrispH2_009745 [Trichoplax sp. H2]|nr:hypothetical protein TrispH2_009745 [Trichoplax sp. H2]|eukprot:RDD37805.1 hypothetical protein TrispH2_009745 [Trichoplax sp. H2]